MEMCVSLSVAGSMFLMWRSSDIIDAVEIACGLLLRAIVDSGGTNHPDR